MILVGGLLAFVGVAYGAERVFGLDHPVQLAPLVSLLFAAIPAFLWLAYFYLQDAKEPEPKHYVFGVYLLGAFVAAPLAGWVTTTLVPVGPKAGLHWYDGDRLVRTILVIALVQEFTKYLVVRYTVYLSDEFDEPMDGIVYMTAAGIGFATAENFRYFQGLDGEVFLAIGASNAVVTTLAHACFAGVLGYALGRAKHGFASDGGRTGELLAGLFVATLLNGGFAALENVVKVSGVKMQAWRGLAWAAGFAAVVFFAVSFLMRRQQQAAPARS